ncbi:nucleotide sugar dehydrogenase [Pseudoxanthomonas sp. PXM01]|nr:nucleotide sugar dehydrogenase [Pseudoxanthomonas sp. PXM01]
MQGFETNTLCAAATDDRTVGRQGFAPVAERSDDEGARIDDPLPSETLACATHVWDWPEGQLGRISAAVIGLGHAGLPMAVAMARMFPTIGFDIDEIRIWMLRRGVDCTGEVSESDLARTRLDLHDDRESLAGCNFFIVAVPTPLTAGGKPDLSLLEAACALIGGVMRPGAIVVFESTVFPGATEEVCGPALERASGLACGIDFKLAYSPERVNPGDPEHTLESVIKVVSAQDAKSLAVVASVYEAIIGAGVHRAASIKVAEAAKVLETTQRDVNIALMNEMAKICALVGIRTADVLKTASTKWNFLPFTPGLVGGGHHIGVEPLYLNARAEQLGYHPEIILAGRRVNDSMPAYVASRIVLALAAKEKKVRGARVGVLGLAFKEGIGDLRDSKAFELAEALGIYGIKARVADTRADFYEARREYGIDLEDATGWTSLDVLVLAVPHPEYVDGIHTLIDHALRPGGLLVDIKSVIEPSSLREDVVLLSL